MLFCSPGFDDHEEVIFLCDPSVRLKAIIAIHSTLRGPAIGGCRIKRYDDEQAALGDVLKLARAMTYKSAVCGLPFGGGKAVIIADPKQEKSPRLLRSFAHRLNLLRGRYQTADDMGSTVMDMELMREITPYARGIPTAEGLPCPATAYGVFCSIKAGLSFHHGADDDIAGYSVAIQGVGSVGRKLCEYLVEEGTKVFVSDTDPTTLQSVVEAFGVTPVAVEDIHRLEVDVFSPCATGAVIHEQNVHELGATIVAGAANNQLSSHRCSEALRRRGILYAPDFVANAGGLIDLAREGPDYSVQSVLEQTATIHDRVLAIFEESARTGRTTHDIAMDMATERLQGPPSATAIRHPADERAHRDRTNQEDAQCHQEGSPSIS
ncbi:MAG: Glu/Leu/Phe/Val dehydrogenase dimerization domain-containing protein [Myxococcota bacterium]